MVNSKQIVDYIQKDLGLDHLPFSHDLAGISGPSNFDDANETNISFVNHKYENNIDHLFDSIKAGILIVQSEFKEKLKLQNNSSSTTVIFFSSEPKNDFVRICSEFFKKKQAHGISDKADIGENVKIGENAFIAAFACIGDDVEIGNDCQIGSGVSIANGTIIGDNVKIESNTSIGGEGFGFVKNEGDQYETFPHFGKVIIGNNVYIGSNTCIDRGSLSNTVIENGVKIDNLVHIAHNVRIGENTLVIANSMIAGSTKIGKNVWVAPSTSIINGIKIGDNATVGMGSVVVKSVEENTVVFGIPAKKKEGK
jgi:UDP-3-O-[3-hydroxymyristoyl] glucosamine N-acyltransferase